MAGLMKEEEQFDAAQYAFFGGEVSQEIELGGLDDEDDIVLGGAFDEDEEKAEAEILDVVSQMDDLSVDVSERSNSYMYHGLGHLNDAESDHDALNWSSNQQRQVIEDMHGLYPQNILSQRQWPVGKTGFPHSPFGQYTPTQLQAAALMHNAQQVASHGNVPPNSNYRMLPPSPRSLSPFSQYGSNNILNHPPSPQSPQRIPRNMHLPVSGGSIQEYLQQQIAQQHSQFSQGQIQRQPGHSRVTSSSLHQMYLNHMPSAPPLDRADGRDYYDGREYYHDYHQQNRRPYKQGSYVSHNIHNKNTGRQPFRSKYMSADEIESIARIQLAATHINDPYIDDYYHQASQAKLAGGSPHGRRPFAPFHLRDSTSHRRSPALQPTFVPVDGLGKVAFSSIRRPRPLLEVDDSSGGDTNKDVVRPLEQEPMLAARIAIEDGLCSLLDVDDIDRFLSVSQLPDGGAQLRRQRQMILESLAALLQLVDPPRGNNGSGSFETNAQIIGDDRKDDFVFLRLVVSLSKGRKMVCRYLKLLPQGSLLVQIVCTAVFRHLRFLFGLPQNDPNAARATTELAETVANCVSRMNLNSLRACLAAVVSTPEHPPLKLFASGPSDGASLVLKSVLNRATSLLTNPGIPFPPEDRAMWQVVFDHFFHLLYTFCTNKFDSILCSLAMSSSGGHPLSINTLAAEAMTKEMPIELLRSSLPHMNEHQRKSLLEFTQRSVAFGAAGGQTLG